MRIILSYRRTNELYEALRSNTIHYIVLSLSDAAQKSGEVEGKTRILAWVTTISIVGESLSVEQRPFVWVKTVNGLFAAVWMYDHIKREAKSVKPHIEPITEQ